MAVGDGCPAHAGRTHATVEVGRSRCSDVTAVALFALITAGLHVPGLLDGPTLDGAVFTEIAVELRDGLLPYRDLWDHKPPGIYAAFALAQTALPGFDPWLGPWLLSIAASVLIAGLTYMLLLGGGWWAALAGGSIVAVYVSMYPISLGGGQTEPFAVAALLASYALAGRSGMSLRAGAACGALAAVAVTTSLLALPAVLAVGIMVARPRTQPGASRAVARLLAFVLVGFIVLGVAMGAATVAGILPDAWSALVSYNGAFVAVNRARVSDLVAIGSSSILFLAPLLVPCATGLSRWVRTRGLATSTVAAVVWAGATSLAILASGRLEPHYLILIVPPLALLAVPAGRATMADWRGGPMPGIAVVAVTALVATSATISLWLRTSPYANQPQVRAVAAWLRSQRAESGALFVWGNEPDLYYEADLTPATAFVYVFPLLTPGYGGPELSRSVAQALAERMPRWVIDAGSQRPGEIGIVPLLAPRPVFEDGRSLDSIDPIRQVVRDHYGPPVEVHGWLVYERQTDGESPDA